MGTLFDQIFSDRHAVSFGPPLAPQLANRRAPATLRGARDVDPRGDGLRMGRQALANPHRGQYDRASAAYYVKQAYGALPRRTVGRYRGRGKDKYPTIIGTSTQLPVQVLGTPGPASGGGGTDAAPAQVAPQYSEPVMEASTPTQQLHNQAVPGPQPPSYHTNPPTAPRRPPPITGGDYAHPRLLFADELDSEGARSMVLGTDADPAAASSRRSSRMSIGSAQNSVHQLGQADMSISSGRSDHQLGQADMSISSGRSDHQLGQADMSISSGTSPYAGQGSMSISSGTSPYAGQGPMSISSGGYPVVHIDGRRSPLNIQTSPISSDSRDPLRIQTSPISSASGGPLNIHTSPISSASGGALNIQTSPISSASTWPLNIPTSPISSEGLPAYVQNLNASPITPPPAYSPQGRIETPGGFPNLPVNLNPNVWNVQIPETRFEVPPDVNLDFLDKPRKAEGWIESLLNEGKTEAKRQGDQLLEKGKQKAKEYVKKKGKELLEKGKEKAKDYLVGKGKEFLGGLLGGSKRKAIQGESVSAPKRIAAPREVPTARRGSLTDQGRTQLKNVMGAGYDPKLPLDKQSDSFYNDSWGKARTLKKSLPEADFKKWKKTQSAHEARKNAENKKKAARK